MKHALMLAMRMLGRVAPNPSVGCVVVSPDGKIVGRGATLDGGRPHAEVEALKQADTAAKDATTYVTLEPCSHHGRTPPCTEALIDAGVSRVVVATTDPDPRVNGRGIAALRAAGISVSTSILKQEADALNRGFFLRVKEKRPLVTLKIAQSSDGFTATLPGQSQWITGESARHFGHLLRLRHDAILVGIETVIADDPLLTCRISGLEKYSPVRLVLDSRLRLSPASKLARTAREIPTIVFTLNDAGGDDLSELGVEIVRLGADQNSRVDLPSVLENLASRGITRVLVEGGATVSEAFLNAGLADCLEIFTAPMVLGAGGRSAIDPLTMRKLDEAPKFIRISSRSFGPDRLESYAARP